MPINNGMNEETVVQSSRETLPLTGRTDPQLLLANLTFVMLRKKTKTERLQRQGKFIQVNRVLVMFTLGEVEVVSGRHREAASACY
jgi:hypothetical protein